MNKDWPFKLMTLFLVLVAGTVVLELVFRISIFDWLERLFR